MKALWITNIPIGEMANKFGVAASGLWMDVMLGLFKEKGEHEVCVATVGAVRETIHFKHEGISYYMLPGANKRESLLDYKINKEHIEQWKTVIKAESPDILLLWGSEFVHGLAAIKAAPHIPSVIYIQGLLESIGRQYDVGLTKKALGRSKTIRSVLYRDGVYNAQKQYLKRAEKERELFALSQNAICENDWCESYIKRIDYGTRVHRLPLDINTAFEKQNRNKNYEKHSIICNSAGYPIKGLHILLKALYLIRRKYPDVKLYVPGGERLNPHLGFLKMMKKTDYYRYCSELVEQLGLEDNIVWLGRLNQEQLAEQLSDKNVFVLSSTIENHSASLKEAMMVGIPCVASYVGGVPEYVKHGENGFLYQSGEYEMLALYVEKLFEDGAMAERFGAEARADMLSLHSGVDNYSGMVKILEKVISNK